MFGISPAAKGLHGDADTKYACLLQLLHSFSLSELFEII
jgi:hypothetical protein